LAYEADEKEEDAEMYEATDGLEIIDEGRDAEPEHEAQ
jgi:hypothetical protein